MLLDIRQINCYRGQSQVLYDLSLQVKAGEIVTMVGANGAGKTTLLGTISGLLHPRDGQILFDGEAIGGLRPAEIVSRGISHVPEHRQIFDTMTVYDNLLLGAYHRYRQVGRAAIERDIEWVYEIFPILQERRDQIAGTMSGGEQQMLAVGRGLMARPKLLLLDEPSLGLAPRIVKELFRVIGTLRDDGQTILLVEQSARAALRLADRGYVIETGHIRLSGAADDLMRDPRVQAAYLGGHAPIEEADGRGSVAEDRPAPPAATG